MPELHPRYYLHNFESLCESVREQYEDLLTAAERRFLEAFSGLDDVARCLYVRLVSRRGPLFRQQQLAYQELGCLDGAIADLLATGLVVLEREPALDDLFRVYRKAELEQIFATRLPQPAPSRKRDLESAIEALALSREEQLSLWQAVTADRLLRVANPEVVDLLQLLFFGNGYQSLTDFVLSDIGVASYFPYSLDRSYRLFSRREEIDEYRRLQRLRDEYHEAKADEQTDRLLALVQPLLETDGAPLLNDRRDRLRNRVARQLERQGEVDAALALYAISGAHPARERAIRLLQGRRDYAEALALCETVEPDPWCEAELDFVRRQKPVLKKKLGQPSTAAARHSVAEEKLSLPPVDGRVEQAAAGFYAQQWPVVAHVESRLLNSLFGLALWDLIFAPLPGAFVNPFQSAPLDMYSGEFFRRRRGGIEQRLASLANPSTLRDEVLTAYGAHQGYTNSWVAWRAVDEQLIERALTAIPAGHLLAMFRRILFDPAANRSGMPDLVALGDAGCYRLIEVKGPGDQLQLNQRRWLRFFEEQGIPWGVVRVEWDA